MLKKLLYLSLIVIAGIISCKPTQEQGIQRPIENWIFRSVLDGKPRMIIQALHDDMWAAWSTETGALYKLWKGRVLLEGAVYTHAHGPQPMTIGDAYFENSVEKPFTLMQGDKSLESRLKYIGHRLLHHYSRAELMYELTGEGLDAPIKVYEMADYDVTEGGSPIFTRTFNVENPYNDINVHFSFNVSSIVNENLIKSDGTLNIKNSTAQKHINLNYKEVEAELILNNNAHTYLNVTLLSTPLLPNTNIPDVEADEEGETAMAEGAKLISKSDCRTCHNKNLKTIGPAYVDIAEKYPKSDESIEYLISKIKNGGSGVWGSQMMNPHPELPVEDIRKMVNYILSLSTSEKTEEISKPALAFKSIEIEDEIGILPGSMVRIYNLDRNARKMPAFTEKDKAIQAGIMSNFDNIHGAAFKELSDYFALTASGYLWVEEPGIYAIETWSDDGSKLSLHGELIIDNDGLHGNKFVQAELELSKGWHPFFLEYFQGAGGKYLSLNWKRPGQKRMEVIPSENIFHEVSQQGKLTGLSLPMATVTQIPGDRFPVEDVHPAFTLSQARPSWFEPKVGGMDFFSDGRLVISTWDPEGAVYVLSNTDGDDPEKIEVKKIAKGLAEPLGLKVVNDVIYVIQKQEMTKLLDTDGDGIIDEYISLSNDWLVSANFHEFGFGLEYKDGHLYAALATAIQPGGASVVEQIKDRGKVVRVNIETGATDFVAAGLRTPNGVGIGYNGELFVSDNEGDWLPSSKILHVTEGAWFGNRSVDPDRWTDAIEKPPLVWLPQDEIGNSPSTPSYLNVGVFKNQMIHGEVTNGGVKRVFVEEVNGELQGAVFRFIQGLEAGINRLAWAPDGSLYVGGIGNPGNWGHAGTKWFGLQRLTFNGNSAFEMLATRLHSNGVEIEFTQSLEAPDGWNPGSYEIKQWYYKPTADYGGPKMDEKLLKVKSSTVSEDRKKVFLEIEGLKAGHVLYIRLKDHFISEEGNPLWSTEAWYTMNNIPANKPGTVKVPPFQIAHNTLSPPEKEKGWKLLFDGKSLEHWRNFKQDTIGKSWIIDNGAIHLNAVMTEEGGWQVKNGGDIITQEEYEDFELRLEWKISNCGNSGIMFNVSETGEYDYVWQTGPEMQILDNTCHPDTRYVTHRAGDLYDMISTRVAAVKPAGEWNAVRIRSKGGEVHFYLNGQRVVEFTMHNNEWQERIKKSKFKDMPGFGQFKKGHISLQDHSDKVWFRNIKIREL
jgi:cytochrome c